MRLADICQLWQSAGVWASGPGGSLVVTAAGERIEGLAVADSLGPVLGLWLSALVPVAVLHESGLQWSQMLRPTGS